MPLYAREDRRGARKLESREKREIRANEQLEAFREAGRVPGGLRCTTEAPSRPAPEPQRRSRPRGSTGRRSIRRLTPPPPALRDERRVRRAAA